MNILKKAMAPITDEAWKEIIDRSAKIFKIYLTAREFVDIDGPHGLQQGGISTGRLLLPQKQSKEGINYGLREFLPLVEIRKPFELDIWELDNINRGARDIDLEPLEEAAKEIALFEDNAIYNGFEESYIKGFVKSTKYPEVKFSNNPNDFLKTIGAQIISLKKDGVDGPYTLIVNDGKWEQLMSLSQGYPIIKQMEDIIEGQVILKQGIDHSLLVSERGGDYELTLGQDISIGYDGHDIQKVKLYLTESFTFRILSPEAIRILSDKDLK